MYTWRAENTGGTDLPWHVKVNRFGVEGNEIAPMTLAFMLAFSRWRPCHGRSADKTEGRTPRAESACVLARSLVTPAADLW